MRTWKGGGTTTDISHVTHSLLSLLALVCRAGVTSDLLCQNPPQIESGEQNDTAWDCLLLKRIHCSKWGNISWDRECLGKCLVPHFCLELWVISCLLCADGEEEAVPCHVNPGKMHWGGRQLEILKTRHHAARSCFNINFLFKLVFFSLTDFCFCPEYPSLALSETLETSFLKVE